MPPGTDEDVLALAQAPPGDPILQTLLASLAAQGGAFTLTPALVQATPITDLLGDLLRLPGNQLALTGVEIGSTSLAVLMTAQASLFGVTTTVRFVFSTGEKDDLQLTLTASLGAMMLQQMLTAGMLPSGQYEPSLWLTGLAGFSAVDLTLTSADACLRIGGTPSAQAWSVLSLSGLSLGPVAPAIRVHRPPYPRSLEWRPAFTTTLTLGTTSLPVLVTIPYGLNGWVVALDAPDGIAPGQFTALLPLFGGNDLSNLPTGLSALSDVWITRLSIGFPPTQTPVWTIGLGLSFGQPGGSYPPGWTIIDQVLALDAISTDLTWTLVVPPNGSPRAAVSGTVSGQISVLGRPFEAIIPIPADADFWTIESSAPIPLDGPDQLAAYLGNPQSTFLSSTLALLGNFGQFTLTDLSVGFIPPPAAALRRVSFGLTVSSWSIPSITWFKASDIELAVAIEQPFTPTQQQTSIATAMRLAIAERLDILVGGAYDGATGLLTAAARSAPVGSTTLADLASLVSADTVTANVPATLPVDHGFQLDRLAFSYDTAQSYLQSLELSFGYDERWVIVKDLLAFSAFDLQLSSSWSSATASAAVTARIAATLTLAGVDVTFAAETPAGAAPWTFSAFLAGEATIDFAGLLSRFAPGDALPTGWSFPATVTLQTLSASLTPATGAFSLDGAAFIDWSFTLADATVDITQLAGALTLPGGDGPASASITGGFSLAGLTGTANLALGGADAACIIAITLAAGPIAPAGQVDALCGAGTYEAVPVPDDFTMPGFAQASAVLDLTHQAYAIQGQFGNEPTTDLYGEVALIVMQDGGADWGFMFAAALDNWSFADISEALTVVDTWLSVDKASAAVVISSLPGDIPAAVTALIPALGPQLGAAPGLNVYATLTFTGELTALVADIVAVSAAGPFTLQGFIPAQSGTSSFSATLGSLTLLQTLTFEDLTLTYEVADASSLALAGSIVVPVGSSSASFAGTMTLDQTAATISVQQTSQSISNPLGLPNTSIDGLGLSLTYTFATSASTLTLQGSVSIGSFGVTGQILFLDGTAAVTQVVLTEPVSIDAIFQQMLGSAWPTGLFDLTLQSGALSYAPQQVTIGETTYQAGLTASAQVSIYALTSLNLAATLTPAPATLVASAQPATPIDWGFISFYGTDNPDIGPLLTIDSATGIFELTAGMALFGTAAATAQMTVTPDAGITGTLTLAVEVPPFGQPSFDFVWTDDEFTVTGWSLPDLDLPPFSFENIGTTDACGAAGIIASLPIDNDFDLDIDFSINLLPPGITLTLNGSFDLVCNSSYYNGTILSVPVVNASLTIPFSSDYGWSDFAQSCVDCLQQAAASIFDNLIQNPANLAKLLAVGGISFAKDAIVDYLTCRGEPEASAEAFAEAAVSGVATSVTLTLLDGGAVFVGGVAGVYVAASGLFTNGGNSGGGGDQPAPVAPGAPTLSWSAAADGLQASWSAVDNATAYAVNYLASGSYWQSTDAAATTTQTIAVSPGPLYTVSVTASGPGGASPAGGQTAFQTIGAPANLAAGYQPGTGIVATWNAVTGATGYQAAVTQGGQALSPQPAVVYNGTGCTITASQFAAGGDFVVSVTASAPQMVGPASSLTVTIAVLPAPTGLTLTSGPDTVQASWTGVTGATGYALQILDGGGTPLTPQPAVTVDTAACTATIGGAPLANGEAIEVEIQATAPGSTGQWCAPVPLTILWLPAPTGFGLVYDTPSSVLTLCYDPVADATAYQLDATDGGSPPGVQATLPPDTVKATGLSATTSYAVTLAATAAGAVGPAAGPLTLLPTPPAAPISITVTSTPGGLLVSFTPVAGASAYEAELLDSDLQPLVPPVVAIGPAPPIALSTQTLVDGQSYAVQVRTLVSTSAPEEKDRYG